MRLAFEPGFFITPPFQSDTLLLAVVGFGGLRLPCRYGIYSHSTFAVSRLAQSGSEPSGTDSLLPRPLAFILLWNYIFVAPCFERIYSPRRFRSRQVSNYSPQLLSGCTIETYFHRLKLLPPPSRATAVFRTAPTSGVIGTIRSAFSSHLPFSILEV